jgi:quinol monooxygenase YgiN
MATIAVRHTVADFAAWKPVFDEHGAIRKEHGCTGEAVFRDAANPNDVLILTNWPSLREAREFADDPSLADAMKRGGVVGPPRIEFYEEVSS